MKRILLAVVLLCCCCSVASAAEPLFEITIRINWPVAKSAPKPVAHRPKRVETQAEKYARWANPDAPQYRHLRGPRAEMKSDVFDHPDGTCGSDRGSDETGATHHDGYPIQTDSKGFKYVIDKYGKYGARNNQVYIDGSDWVGGPG